MGLKASGVAAYPMRQAAKAWSLFVRLLHERTILVLTIMFCGGVGTTMWHFSRLSSKLIESTALQGTSVQSESLEELRTIYTSEVVERVRSHGIEVTHDYRTKEGAIPLPVTFSMELGKRIGERGSGIQVRLYSEYPFPFRKGGGPRDDFEREALRQLRKDPDRPFFRFEDFEGRPSLRYATADRMRASCVACHNSHAQSPKTDWKVGDVRGVLEIIRPLDIAAAQTRAGLKESLGLLATMAVLGLSGLALVIGRLRRTSAELENRIAERSAAEARLATMHEINLAATSTLDLRGLLNVLMEKIDVLLPYTAVLVWLVDRKSGLLERAACWNLDEVEWKRRKLTGTPPLVKEAMTSKTPVVARNVQTDPRTLDPEFYRKQGLVSYLGVPLQIKGQVLGVLVFLTREEHQFSDEEVEFLSTLAGQAAMAIHNSQLHEQSKRQAAELMQANKVKNEFLGFVSHELRTPVNVIMGYGAILQSKMLGEINAEQDNALEKMSANSRTLLGMIEQLLQATKIEAGAIEPEIHELQLSGFLDELRSAYSLPLKKEIRLDWNYPADLPAIKTDGEKLRHILLNVVGNAIKYTKQGSIAMSARHLPEAGQIEFEVADTGIGIPQEELPHIFEMFSQVKGGRTLSSGGVGLGLHIVKKFTEILGGDIRVTSEEGIGSTFTLTIPSDGDRRQARDNPDLRADESSDPREN